MNIVENHILKIQVIENIEELEKFQEQWNNLVDQSKATIYQRYEWLITCWKHYHNPETDKLFCILVSANDKLVGIIPIYQYTIKFLNIPVCKHIYFLGSGTMLGNSFGIILETGPSDYLDIIVQPGFEYEILQFFLNYLEKNHKFFDKVILTNIHSESVIYNYISKIKLNSKINIKIKKGEICPYINLPSSFEEYMKSRSQSVRRRFSQSWKAIQSDNLFKLKISKNEHELFSNLEETKIIHQQKWNRLGYGGFFADTRFEKFFKDFTKSFYNEGFLWYKALETQDGQIAGRLAFKYKNRYYDYFSGINDQFPEAKRRPGLALLLMMIHDAIQDGSNIVDLLRGNEEYKKDFTDTFNITYNIVIYKRKNYIISFLKNIILFLRFVCIVIIREYKIFKTLKKIYSFPQTSLIYSNMRIKSIMKKIQRIKKKEGF